MSKPDSRSAQTSAPAGTGNVPGLGEAFSINLNTGQGVYSYRLPLPDGVAGHGPKLTLEYGHGSALGPFGLGWRLPIRSITRRLDFGVPEEGTVERYLDGGTELAPLSDGRFAPLIETAFTRYTRTSGGWRVEERNGAVHELGLSAATRLADPAHPDRADEYLLERTLDTSGNAVLYAYLLDGGCAYPSEIRYAAYAVRFVYENRADVRRDGRAGYLRTRAKRCREINLLLDPGPSERRFRSWRFVYVTDALSRMSLLSEIRMVSAGTATDGSLDVVRPAVQCGYARFDTRARAVRWMESPDGPDPPALNDPDVALVTLDGAPLPGVLQVVNGRQHYWPNRGDGSWGHPRPVLDAPAVHSFGTDRVAFVDVDASGTADMLVAGPQPLHGYYENGGAEGWKQFVAYPRGSRATPEWTSGRLRLTDTDGDGRIDAVMSTERAFAVWSNQGADGWADPTLSPKGTAANRPDLDFADPLVQFADMTGDGLQDLVRVHSGHVEYWPSLGYGRFGAPVTMTGAPRMHELERNPGSLILTDVDGDGCADLVRVSPSGVEVYFNQNGSSFSAPMVIDPVPAPLPDTVRAVNMNGRTRAGLLWNSLRGSAKAYVHLELGAAAPAYTLTSVDNGSGLQSTITYRWAVQDYLDDLRAGFPWRTNLPFPIAVVAGSRDLDRVTGQVTTTEYRYHEGHFEPGRRQFQGFRRAERIERGDESRADVRTEFEYIIAEERQPGRGPEFAAMNGLQRQTAVYSLDGTAAHALPHRVESCTHGLTVLGDTSDGRKRVFIFVVTHRSEDRERSGDARVEQKTFTYDARGNVILERLAGSGVRGGVAAPTRQRTTEIQYTTGTTRWIVDRPCRVVVRDESGAIVSEKRRYYDGSAFIGLPLGAVDRGLLTREEQLVMSETAFQAHYAGMDAAALGYHTGVDRDGVLSRFTNADRAAFDSRGLRITQRDATGFDRAFEYDAAGVLRTKLTDVLGETRFESDRAAGEPTTITYGDGSVARFAYDAQGRVVANALPGDDILAPPRRFNYDDMAVPHARTAHFLVSADTTTVSRAVSYFDGRGKECQQRVEVGDGRVIVSGTTIKNPWGDLKQEYEPAFDTTLAYSRPATAGRPHRTIFYDARGRAVRTIDFSGGVSTAEYRPFEVLLRDANDTDASAANVARGQFDTPRREEFDTFRDRTAIVELLGSGQTLRSDFSISGNGDVVEIRDAHGTASAYEYDRLGRRLVARHREAGERRMWYDGRNKVVRARDAAGNELSAENDALGRLTRLSSAAGVLEQYTYDVAAQQALGRLAEVTYAGGSQRLSYDSAGRLTRREYRFEGVAAAQTIDFEYDRLGRPTASTYADGTRLTRQLTANGWTQAISGFIDEVRYDPRGLPTRLAFANQVVTDITYTAGPGRVRQQRTVGPGGQVMEDITYEYDALQMLLAQSDTATGGSGAQTLEYDPLYQLRRATTTHPAPVVSRDYTYTGLNLTRFDEAASTLHYDDALHPDRVAGLTRGTDPRFDLTYDANGNLLTLPAQTFAYSAKNELERFQSGAGLVATYRYDHEGNRVSKTVTPPGGAAIRTLFIGSEAEIRDGMPTYFVNLGELRVGLIGAGVTKFVHSNYLGNTSFFSDASGTKIAAIAYRPFGNLASSSGDVDLRTYGAHPFDTESGLYYMKRRYYAPAIGRFLTPDPLALYQPQKAMYRARALHPYAYAGNDPLNNVDPEGLSFWSVVGAIVGVIAAVALGVLVVMTGGLLLGALIVIGVVAISYIVADASASSSFGEFMRGFMIGFNAGLNFMIATALFGPFIGVALGVINFLAAFDGVASNPIYQGILGWSSWLMPMSWLATGVGLIFFVINVIVAFFTHMVPGWFGGAAWDAARINSVSIDWGTGTIVMHGGLLTPAPGGYNLGNFAYINRNSTFSTSLVGHETGHTLNVAAFGAIFHYIGAIDENVVPGRGANAYAEKLADSNDPGRTVADTSIWQEIWV